MLYLATPFVTYFKLGWTHITDLNGFDHILFLIALCAIYRFREIKQVAILATAFTVGHSITLGLAALKVITPPSNIIEFLIPVTILITALANTLRTDKHYKPRKIGVDYFMAIFFGLIHGMGFSNFFRGILGQNAEIVTPLLAFNIGLEIGQLLIVLVVLAISFFFMDFLKVKQRSWNLFVSGLAAGMAIMLMMETKFW